MDKSLITKKVIAHALKRLMSEKPFQKISISEIMSTAQMRRQTFYDHFLDKYDLLAWIYHQETKENIEDFLDYEHWTKSITRLLYYLQENKAFYQNALLINEQNDFREIFFNHSKKLIQTVVLDIKKHQALSLDVNEIDFYCTFYAHAFVGVILDWLTQDCDVPVKVLSLQIRQQLKQSLK